MTASPTLQKLLQEMTPQQRSCRQCSTNFGVTQEHIDFYRTMETPLPTLCPACRNVRRFAVRNERTFYARNCDATGKPIVAIYSKDKPFKVYSHEAWWSDEFDGITYGRDYDPNRSFFEQFQELQLAVPRICTLSSNSENSAFTNQSGNNKNCYMAIEVFDSENVLYSWWVMGRDCVDCSFLPSNCEQCYEVCDASDSYGCFFSQDLKNCNDVWFCFDARNCKNCILSSNIRGKEYMVRNKQVTKEEFLAERAKLLTNIEAAKAEYRAMKQTAIHIFARHEGSEECIGSNFINCRKVIGNDGYDSENCTYCERSFAAKDSMDSNCFGLNASNHHYESQGTTGAYIKFSSKCYYDSFIEYCDNVYNSDYCFGCVGLKRKKFCILNKQYTEEEYNVLKTRIVEDMLARGEYGEFFPMERSPFGYNETVSQEYRPLTKEQTLQQGLRWKDVEDQVTGGNYEPLAITTYADPAKAAELLQGVIRCEVSGRPFRIISAELGFYLKHSLPIPRRHPDVRHADRNTLRPPRAQLHNRPCTNPSRHDTQAPCTNMVISPYAVSRPERIYCKECYEHAVY